jgi:hypothetical protein
MLFCEREPSPTMAGSRQPLLIASRTPLQKCVSCWCNGCVHHGWLTPAALGARCSFAAKALFAMDKRTFTGAAGVSPPWLAEMHLHGRYRKHAENCYRWVGRRRCHRGRSVRGSTRTMRSNTAKRHCRPGRLPSHGGLTPPLLVVRAFVHRKSRHFTGTRSVRTKSGDRTPAAMLPRITYSALRVEDISRASETRIPCKETRVPVRNLGGCWPWFAAPRRRGWRGINRLDSSWT